MKKLITLLSLFLLSSSVFAIGAGIQLSVKPALNFETNNSNGNPVFFMGENFTGTYRTERFPAVYAVGLDLEQKNESIFIGVNGTFDYWLFEKQLVNILNCYGAVGATADFRFASNNQMDFDAGLRGVLGLNWHFYDGYLELYCQQVVSPLFVQDIKKGKPSFNLAFPFESGIRIHF